MRRPSAPILALTTVLALASLLIAESALAKSKGKGKKVSRAPEDLFNPFLGVEFSHWLVGPISEIAGDQEIEHYLALRTDAAAAAFVDAFWVQRAEGLGPFQKKPRKIFEERADVADGRYSEGTRPGRNTDRGTIFILYGEPEEIEFETPLAIDQPTQEVWRYPKDAAAGLDGDKPKRNYRFVEIDGSKVLYSGQTKRRDPLDRQRGFGA